MTVLTTGNPVGFQEISRGLRPKADTPGARPGNNSYASRRDASALRPLPGSDRWCAPWDRRCRPNGLNRRLMSVILSGCCLVFALLSASSASAGPSLAKVCDQVQPKIVKIFGTGGLHGLEIYQSGFLISADGYVLTVFSHVLDEDPVTVILSDGRKFHARLVRPDPRLELRC